jgi:hypothetical protein
MSKIEECIQALASSLQSIAELEGRAHPVYTPEKLVRLIKGAKGPQVGIVYEGMTGVPESGATKRSPTKVAHFGLYLALESTPLSDNVVQEVPAINLLDKIGIALEGKNAPSGHPWEFLSEGYSDSFPDRALWVQRWSTRVVGR